MELIYIALIIVIIVIVIWVVFIGGTKSRCLSELNGMWIADSDFCEESGIELMTIYFGDCPQSLIDEQSGGTNKLCWILIINDKGEYNHITVANIKGGTNIKDKQYEFELSLKDSPDNIFSTDLTINIVPGQLITIIDADTKIFEGLKNKEASEAIEFNIGED